MVPPAEVPPAEVSAALLAASSLGDFFALAPPVREGDWSPVTALADPERLRERIEAARTVIATMAGAPVDRRVAASTVSLGLFARLVAPSLGCLVTSGVLPRFSSGSLWWQPVLGGPLPLSADPVDGLPEASREDFERLVLVGLVNPLALAFRDAGVSPVVLRGNVASALGGAARMIGTARPALKERAWSFTAEVLALPSMAGTATIEAGPSLRRRSCCLFYRVPGGGFCADCILADRGALSR